MPGSIIATNRFGLGARPGELRDIGDDARGWLVAQVSGVHPVPTELSGLTSSTDAVRLFAETLRMRRERQNAAPSGGDDKAEINPRMENEPRKRLVAVYENQVAARYRIAARSQESFRERLVHFWTNHFAVSADKVQVLALAGALENEAIRANLDGRFEDLLLAVESHAAMILYLDNATSVGPNSKAAQRAAKRTAGERKLDINENLAREILELHTLGVNGGYTQQDVTVFALALTGWSLARPNGKEAERAGQFYFRDQAHEPGVKSILGKRYPDDGVGQPRAVLRDLAVHPATATHVATKLARHFIADEPPRRAVERLAKTFRDTEGDLPSLHRALVECPEAWEHPPVKFKTPHDYLVSTFRMLDDIPSEPRQILAPFQQLGQRPYAPGSPAGWPDTAGQWDGPDALLKRIEWASAVGKRIGSKVQPLELAAQSLGTALSERTRVAISRAESSAQGTALLLASPEFQRR